MEDFNLILMLWRLSLFISVISLFIGVFRKSWILITLSMVTSIPIAYYYSGAVNGFRYIGFTPLILLLLAISFWFLKKKK